MVHFTEEVVPLFKCKDIKKLLHETYHTMKIRVRPQMPDSAATKNMINSVESTSTGLKSVILVLIASSMLMVGAMSYMIIFMNIFQIIIHLPILSTVVPANVAKFFNVLCPIATYDFISSDMSTELVFDFDYER